MKTIFKITSIQFMFIWVILMSGCKNDESKKQADNNALLGIVGISLEQAKVQAERDKSLVLNGKWQANTGSATSTASFTTISAVKGTAGAWVDDSSSFGGYNSCYIIIDFDNTTKTMITQNPEKQGNCPNGFADTLKGKYNKIVWTKGATDNQYYYCSVTYGQASQTVASAVTDNSIKTNPSVTGCCSNQACTTTTNAWSKLDRVTP